MSYRIRRVTALLPFCAMPGVAAFVAALSLSFIPSSADAVVKGRPSSLGSSVLRVASRGGAQCTGVAIGRQLVVSAAHCGGRSVRANGISIGVRAVTRSAVLDDGRSVSVSGDAAILKLSAPLPGSIFPVSVGPGDGDTYTIAGYGAVQERYRGSMGALHEAQLMAVARFALVDPQRDSSIGASACFGDSGGPVLRGSQLVGVISRAAHPLPHIACGHITRWAPIVASGNAEPTTVSYGGERSIETQTAVKPRRMRHKRHRRAI